MTLLEIQAIRALPEEYVIPNVKIALGKDFVLALAPGKTALIYQGLEWIELRPADPPQF